MKKIISTIVSTAMAVGVYAGVREMMVVTLKDGTTVEYNVDNVEMVNFQVTEDAFSVIPSGGTEAGYATIPAMLRQQPSEAGKPTIFGFGHVTATTAEDLTAGEYGVHVTVSAAKLYQGDIDLSTDKDSYMLKLVKYTEGGAERIWDNVASGTLTTKINAKNQRVTLQLDAVFSDGTVVTANYEGKPTDVESLDAAVPEIKYGNELFYFDTTGSEKHKNVVSATKSYSSFSGSTTFTLNFDSEVFTSSGGTTNIKIAIPETMLNSGDSSWSLAETTGEWRITFGGMFFYGATGTSMDTYSRIPDNGTLKVAVNDGVYEIHLEIINSYVYNGLKSGTTERIIVHYEGEIK